MAETDKYRDQIKTCPFCGNGIVNITVSDLYCDCHIDRNWRQIVCCKCGATAESSKTRKQAIANWNRRTNDLYINGHIPLATVKRDEDEEFEEMVDVCGLFMHPIFAQSFKKTMKGPIPTMCPACWKRNIEGAKLEKLEKRSVAGSDTYVLVCTNRDCGWNGDCRDFDEIQVVKI